MVAVAMGDATNWNQRHACGGSVNRYGAVLTGGSIDRSIASTK